MLAAPWPLAAANGGHACNPHGGSFAQDSGPWCSLTKAQVALPEAGHRGVLCD